MPSSRVAVLGIAIAFSLACAVAIWVMRVYQVRVDKAGAAPHAYAPIRDDDAGGAPAAVEMVEMAERAPPGQPGGAQ